MLGMEIFQLGYLVEDIGEACERWGRSFGAGPFFVFPHHRTESFSYRGTPTEADVSYAFGYLGDLMIQLTQQHDATPSIYLDMFPGGGEGLHHVACLVPDYAEARARLLGQGYELACELYADGVDAAYFDTRRDFGTFLEIHGDPWHIVGGFERWRRAHRYRKDGDPQLVVRESRTPDR